MEHFIVRRFPVFTTNIPIWIIIILNDDNQSHGQNCEVHRAKWRDIKLRWHFGTTYAMVSTKKSPKLLCNHFSRISIPNSNLSHCIKQSKNTGNRNQNSAKIISDLMVSRCYFLSMWPCGRVAEWLQLRNAIKLLFFFFAFTRSGPSKNDSFVNFISNLNAHFIIFFDCCYSCCCLKSSFRCTFFHFFQSATHSKYSTTRKYDIYISFLFVPNNMRIKNY